MSTIQEVIGSISESGEFDWVINVSCDKVLERHYITSPKFSFSSSSWNIRMYPKGRDSDSQGWISLYLSNIALDSEKEVSFSFDMTFQDVRLRKISTKHRFVNSKTFHGFPRFILKETVNSLYKEANCTQLMIKLKMKKASPCVVDTLHRVRKKGREILRQNYGDMLLNSDDHDLVLKVKDKEFRVHRLIMKNRCTVFKSMLFHEMLEKSEGVVEIPDCDPLAFQQFLLYIYNGELSLSKSTVLGLYYIADKYDIENLKETCCAFIRNTLTVQAICDVIKLALNHNDASLLEFATNYFVSNAKEIFITLEWQSFNKENPIKANELVIKAFDKISSYCVCSSKNDADAE